jgi:hypothetical protein
MIRVYALAILAIFVLLTPTAKVNASVTSMVITEIMKDPARVSDTNGEWFEVYNNSSTIVSIAGLIIRDDDTDSHLIDKNSTLVIDPFAYFLFCRNGNSDENGGVSCGYVYTGISMGNNSDELILEIDGVVIDRVVYSDSDFPDKPGASMVLTDIGDDNNIGRNWHAGYNVFGDGDFGTPGSANSTLPTTTPTITPIPSETPKPTNAPSPTNTPKPIDEPTVAPKPTIKKTPTKPTTPRAGTATQIPKQKPVQLDGKANSTYPFYNELSNTQNQDDESIVKNALSGLGGSFGGVEPYGTYLGKDGTVLATSSASKKGGVSPVPFVVIGGMAFVSMAATAVYIHRNKSSEE